jgi:Glycosyl transferase family 2
MNPATMTDVLDDTGEQPPPLVDVMLLVYRRVRYVRTALESVLQQSIGSWRATVWDNGTGNADIRAEVAELLGDARVSYRATGRELPLAANWTEALAYGNAPYVALLSDDDMWYPDFLARRLEALDAHPECGFAFSECDRIDEEGRTFHSVPFRLHQGVVGREILAKRLRNENIVTPSTFLARRSAYEAVGAAFDGTWRYSDWEMVARLAARFPAYYLATRDNATRTHAQRQTSVDASDPDELLAMVENIDRLFTKALHGYPARGRLARARDRSQILLRSAHDSHLDGGWPAARRLYRRALREYPPVVLSTQSLVIGGPKLLGERAFGALRKTRRSIRRRVIRSRRP